MEIIINDTRVISDIQREFSSHFPFLKLEFFDTPHRENEALPKSKIFTTDKKLGSCRKKHNTGLLEILPQQKVRDLENSMWNNFGLSAQVFRKSGNLWIETSLTDSWTLEQQNREGYEMSDSKTRHKEDTPDLTDRDVWE
ncbi:MAG: hypothetical protein JNK66_13760 [Chitinophagales bacterium]|nr:hypothetical protein [Chitinophagales bacterium]